MLEPQKIQGRRRQQVRPPARQLVTWVFLLNKLYPTGRNASGPTQITVWRRIVPTRLDKVGLQNRTGGLYSATKAGARLKAERDSYWLA
jgi:hypothetical protein